LRNHDVAFDEIDVEEHPEMREQLLAEGFTSLPVVVIRPTDNTAVGFRPEFLKEELL
jgi:glutaredoxin